MKQILSSLFLVLLGGVLVYLLLPQPKNRLPGPIIIEKIQTMGFLVTTKTYTADVIETSLEGKVGSCTAVVIARGDVQVGVDMQRAKFENIDYRAHSTMLVLPPPMPNSPRLDHNQTHVYDIKTTGMWNMVPHQEIERLAVDKAMREGQHRVEAAAAEPGIIAASKRQAEQLLGCIFNQVGWKVTIRWTDDSADRFKT